MLETTRLAGFLAAHAIEGVSKGKSLTQPLVVVEKTDGTMQFIEVTGKSLQEAVGKAEKLLEKPLPGAARAVLAFEAYLNLPPSRTDAIFLRGCCYAPQPGALQLAVPFRAVGNPGGFAVFRPKFFAFEDEGVPQGTLDAFWRGVGLHPPGQAVWSKHKDESR